MRVRRVTLLSLAALALVAVGAVGFGVANIAPLDVLAIIGKSLFGLPVGSDISAGATSIVIDIRLPRILAAIAVGAALATSGAAFQSLLRNPLADPYVLGTSSGAALGAAIAFLAPALAAAEFTLAPLPYASSALEPHIDARTMEIHHTKHHGAYTTNLNAALQGTEWASRSIEEIMANISKLPVAVRNNGGGYYNHNLYWEILAPGGSKEPKGVLLEALNDSFGSVASFKVAFVKAA
jgi:hypothetical protein